MAVYLDNLSNEPFYPGCFSFYFFSIGQGDCCVIGCPDRKVVVVDCGCSSYFGDGVDVAIRNKVVEINGGREIEALILTHPDKDHYNKVGLVFNPAGNPFKIKNVYFSFRSSDTSPFGFYTENGVNDLFYNNAFRTENYYEVTINATTNELRNWTQAMLGNNNPTITNPAGQVVNVVNGTTGTGATWSIKIIAGNVQIVSPSLDARKNAASLIVAASIQNVNPAIAPTTAIIHGDATNPTTEYLTANKAAYVTNVSLAHVPHHGSSRNCNDPNYIELLNPEAAAISVRVGEDSYHLPAETVTQMYYEGDRINAVELFDHPVDGWSVAGDYTPGSPSQEIADAIAEWNTRYPGQIRSDNLSRANRHWLVPPIPADDYIILEPGTGFMLRRETYKQPVRETDAENLDNPYINFILDDQAG